MRYFRVNLPRKYLREEYADELIQTACSIKVQSVDKLSFFVCRFFRSLDQSEEIQTLSRKIFSNQSRRRTKRKSVRTSRK